VERAQVPARGAGAGAGAGAGVGALPDDPPLLPPPPQPASAAVSRQLASGPMVLADFNAVQLPTANLRRRPTRRPPADAIDQPPPPDAQPTSSRRGAAVKAQLSRPQACGGLIARREAARAPAIPPGDAFP
jgi:hypothetical protein